MDSITFQELSKRVSQLELALAGPGKTKEPILDQLNWLQVRLGEIYSLHGELSVLTRLLNELKVEPESDEDSTEPLQVKNKHPEQSPISDLDIESKRSLILLKLPQIKQALANTSDLASMNTRALNYISQSQDKIHNFNADKKEILLRKEQLRHLTRRHYQVLLKNMIVFERYVDLVLRENKFWLNAQEKLGKLEVEMNMYEAQAKLQNKY